MGNLQKTEKERGKYWDKQFKNYGQELSFDRISDISAIRSRILEVRRS